MNVPHIFPRIPLGGWRLDAECTKTDPATGKRYDPRKWDAANHRSDRARVTDAMRVCNTLCKVREQCAASYDYRSDEGVHGGHETPPVSKSSYATPRDRRLREILRSGVPLDDAVRVVQRAPGKAS